MYALFGASTWTSRAAFAAIGWFSVLLLAHLSYKIYRDHRVALGSVVLLATSEIFLLHSRQCRYYSVTVFAEILLVYGAFELLANSKRATWFLASALILQFYTNFIVAAANLPLLVALSWFVWKERRVLTRLTIAVGVFALAALPWVAYARPWQQSRAIIHENPVSEALYYCTEWHFHFLPWIILLLPAVNLFTNAHHPQVSTTVLVRPLEQSLSALLVGYFLILLVPPSELRYLLPLLPVGCLLVAAGLFRYLPSPILATAVIALQATTNLIAVATTFGLNREHPWRAPLFQFIGGLNEAYADRFSDVRDFFSKEAHPGQSVWAPDPEFPTIFYMRLKIIDGRLETPDSLPDWILPQSASGLLEQQALKIPDSIKPYYDTIFIRVHDSDRFDKVPEPDCYQYQSTQRFTDFLIYRKRI
jgi:hypothetical protein